MTIHGRISGSKETGTGIPSGPRSPLKFKQVESSFHKWAHFFSNYQFEHWELINAVWAKGFVQKLKHIKFASARIKYDMIDYIREQTNSRPKKRLEEKGLFVPSSISIHNTINNDTELIELLRDHQTFDEFESGDLFNWATTGLQPKHKLFIKLKYIEDLLDREIGDALGVSESRVSQLRKESLVIVKQRFIDSGINYNNGDLSPEQILERRNKDSNEYTARKTHALKKGVA